MTCERYFQFLWRQLTPAQIRQMERALPPAQRALLAELREDMRWSNAS